MNKSNIQMSHCIHSLVKMSRLCSLSIFIRSDVHERETCLSQTVSSSVLEHVTEEFLHGCVSDGAVEEEKLNPLRAHLPQRWQQQQQPPLAAGKTAPARPSESDMLASRAIQVKKGEPYTQNIRAICLHADGH